MRSEAPRPAMWLAIGFGVVGVALGVVAAVGAPDNQISDRFELWQNLARTTAGLGTAALVVGAIAATRDSNGIAGAVIAGAVALISGCTILVLLTSLPYGH